MTEKNYSIAQKTSHHETVVPDTEVDFIQGHEPLETVTLKVKKKNRWRLKELATARKVKLQDLINEIIEKYLSANI